MAGNGTHTMTINIWPMVWIFATSIDKCENRKEMRKCCNF
jgi:hypothetical protein